MPSKPKLRKTDWAFAVSLEGMAPVIDAEDLDQQFKKLHKKFLNLVKGKDKKKVWGEMTKFALKLERERIKEQKNLDGSAFAPKRLKNGKKGPGSRAMLRKMLSEARGKRKGGTKKRPQVKRTWNESGGEIRTLNPLAVKHHKGKKETVKAWTREDFKRQEKKRAAEPLSNRTKQERIRRGDDDPCTKEQARALRGLFKGTKLKIDGQRVSKTIGNIQKAYTASRAGAIIGQLRRDQGKPPKRQWSIETAPRSVLGLNEHHKSRLVGYFAAMVAEFAYFRETMSHEDYQAWKAGFKLSYGDRASGFGL